MPQLPEEHERLYNRIYLVVRQIPRGQVATYGQIATIVGNCTARMAGYAMAAAPDDVPWQRVVNAKGKVKQVHGDEAGTQKDVTSFTTGGHAWPLPLPAVTILFEGAPVSITSIASVTTAPSTQPPETEPWKLPSASMTR